MVFLRRKKLLGVYLMGLCSLAWACSSGSPNALAVATTKGTMPPSKTTVPPPFPSSRNVLSWPFASSSIWNLPLGQNLVLKPALLPKLEGSLMSSDENILIMTPDAPLSDVYTSEAGWDSRRNRCGEAQKGTVRYQIPISPQWFTDPGYEGSTPNHAGAVLLADGKTFRQTQPIHRCPGGFVVTQYDFDSVDAFGDGRLGAHGGSGLSAVGGAIRVGELVPGSAIRHALKFEVNAATMLAYPADGTPGYRWPADRADGYAATTYRGPNPLLEMGTLLTLPSTFDIESLKSEPARIMARALRDYGAYIVDDTAWPQYSFATEWGPAGRVNDEMIRHYGHRFGAEQPSSCTAQTADCLWAREMGRIIENFAIVTNSTEADPGGPGPRRTFCAPSLNPQDPQPASCPPLVALVPASTPISVSTTPTQPKGSRTVKKPAATNKATKVKVTSKRTATTAKRSQRTAPTNKAS